MSNKQNKLTSAKEVKLGKAEYEADLERNKKEYGKIVDKLAILNECAFGYEQRMAYIRAKIKEFRTE